MTIEIIKGNGPVVDNDGAHALIDAVSPDRVGWLFGLPYTLYHKDGVIVCEPEAIDVMTDAQKRKVKAELDKAVLLPAPQVKKTRLEDTEDRISALEGR